MDGEISTKDLYNLIQGVVVKCDAIQTQNTEIKEEIKEEIRTVKTEISSELNKIKKENENLREENTELRKRLTAIERRLKKYNLIVYGLEEKDTDRDDTNYLLDIINNKLKTECRYSDIREIYRLGKNIEGRRRPLLVEFVNYKLKIELLRNSKELKGTGIYLAQDYIPEDYEKQKVLRSHLKTARENNQKAYIRNNILYVDGEQITYEALVEKINELEKVEEEDEQEETENIQLQTETSRANTQGNASTVGEDKLLSLFEKPTEKKRKFQTYGNENPTKRLTRQKNKM